MLKKAFQITDKNQNYFDLLDLLDTRILLSINEIDIAKRELENSMVAKRRLLKKLLLEEYIYIMEPEDKIKYNSQTGEIMVYTGDNLKGLINGVAEPDWSYSRRRKNIR